jgi:hypothetical protein
MADKPKNLFNIGDTVYDCFTDDMLDEDSDTLYWNNDMEPQEWPYGLDLAEEMIESSRNAEPLTITNVQWEEEKNHYKYTMTNGYFYLEGWLESKEHPKRRFVYVRPIKDSELSGLLGIEV